MQHTCLLCQYYSNLSVPFSRLERSEKISISIHAVMNMNRSMHPKSSASRLYLSQNIGGRDLPNLECLHNRLVLSLLYKVVNYTADENDFLIHIIYCYGNRHKGAFLNKAAIYAAKTLGLGRINLLVKLLTCLLMLPYLPGDISQVF